LGNVVKKAGDKHVTNALGAIQKQLDEIVRRLASIDTNIAAIVTRLETGDVDFT
jgi:flagellin-like hook-associated protein FlgL